MTRNKITTTMLVKARDLWDFDYYIRQMLVDAFLKMLIPLTMLATLFILSKLGILNFLLVKSIPNSFGVFIFLSIPYSIYRVYKNKSVTYKCPNLDLYSPDELFIMVKGLNRKRKLMKGFVNSAAPWKTYWFDILIIVVSSLGLFHQYRKLNYQNTTEFIILISIILSFGFASLFTKRRDANKFDKLQKEIHMKAKSIIFDYLILSNLNPYNHATTKSDK